MKTELIKNFIRRKIEKLRFTSDMNSKKFIHIYNLCKNYTQTSVERMYGLYNAIDYIEQNKIEGDLVECGVWKGGSAMIMAYSLNSVKRNFYLYDTYKGMPSPKQIDKCRGVNLNLLKKWKKCQRKDYNVWNYASLEEVKKNMLSIGYPAKNIHLIDGKVEDTIPLKVPKQISLLRVDIDWYEPTLHCMKYLFPLISSGGVLILDDYGFLVGAQKAIDEYIKENNIPILLNRIDKCCRIGLKIEAKDGFGL